MEPSTLLHVKITNPRMIHFGLAVSIAYIKLAVPILFSKSKIKVALTRIFASGIHTPFSKYCSPIITTRPISIHILSLEHERYRFLLQNAIDRYQVIRHLAFHQ